MSNPTIAGTQTDQSTAEVPIVRWVSPADALSHIETAADCDRATALTSLRTAVGDGRLPVRWLEPENETDAPPGKPEFWRDVTIRPDHGGELLYQVQASRLIKDGKSKIPMPTVRMEGQPRYRGFLVDRDALQEIWPPRELQPARVPADSILRPKKEEIRKIARELYAARNNDPPNLCQAERLIRDSLPRAGRKPVRDILAEPEFAKQRRRSGQRRKR